jgi:hypothetical protein
MEILLEGLLHAGKNLLELMDSDSGLRCLYAKEGVVVICSCGNREQGIGKIAFHMPYLIDEILDGGVLLSRRSQSGKHENGKEISTTFSPSAQFPHQCTLRNDHRM